MQTQSVNPNLQQLFFHEIRAKLPVNLSLVDEIADVLEVSVDSAYRRIRGEKSLSFDEIRQLSVRYQISLDKLMNVDVKSTIFYGAWLNPNDFTFDQYLKNEMLLMQNVYRANKKLIRYEAKDFPPFHYFQFPTLSAFKCFFWMRTILNYPECSRMCFEDNVYDSNFKQTGGEIIRMYSQIPSAEIWSLETINSTIRQIEYYREAGVFRKPESIEMIYDDLIAMLEHIKDEAEVGCKFTIGGKPSGEGTFQLFFNEAYLGHNTIMTEIDDREAVYINHGVLNLMMTHDRDFCMNTRRYFDNTMKKSALISSVNDKERNRFFNGMLEKVKNARNRENGHRKEM